VAIGPEDSLVDQLPDPLDLIKVRGLYRNGAAKDIRVGGGLSLGELGAAAGLSAAAICRYENGSRIPRGRSAIALLRLLEAVLARQ
jgi:predicted transcriptional regulator